MSDIKRLATAQGKIFYSINVSGIVLAHAIFLGGGGIDVNPGDITYRIEGQRAVYICTQAEFEEKFKTKI